MKTNKPNSKWESMPFPTLLNKKKFNVGKIKRNEYLEKGKYPIIDQGQGFIAGYSNDASLVYNGDLPIIVFGDHTRIFKFIDFPFITGADGTQIIVPKKDTINPNFFYYTLLNTPLLNRGYNRHYSLLKEKKLPVPPLVEQRGIVEVLGTVDECIRLTDAVIERAEKLKRGLMQQLLTRGIGHTEYKETLLGIIPKTWKVCTLQKVIKEIYRYPTFYNIEYKENGIGVLKVGNISSEGFIDQKLNEIRYISNELNSKFPRTILHENDLIMAFRGATIGKIALVKKQYEGYNINPNLIKISLNQEKIDPRFFWLLMNSDIGKKQFNARIATTARQTMTVPRYLSINIPLPEIEEQIKISNRIFSIQEKMSIENRCKGNYIKMKQGLMQGLLSGNIRVELKGDGIHRIGYSREANN